MRIALATLLCFVGVAALAQAPAATPAGARHIVLPPEPKNPGTSYDVGAVAPDGIGVAVRENTRTLGAMNKETMTYTPWVDDSVIKPLPVGSQIPDDCVVQTADGKPFDLNKAVASKPTVLIFYRGGWCPFCNAHLRELQKSVGTLQEMGYQLLAVTPDSPDALNAMQKDADLTYTLLSDNNVVVGGKFGLKYKISQQYIEHVKSLNKPDLSAQNDGYMVTPAAYVLDTNGVIRFAYANNNYTVRVSQSALLDAARAALTN